MTQHDEIIAHTLAGCFLLSHILPLQYPNGRIQIVSEELDKAIHHCPRNVAQTSVIDDNERIRLFYLVDSTRHHAVVECIQVAAVPLWSLDGFEE
jgi:hypothetical protein